MYDIITKKMKKIIGVIILMLITIGTFGQKFIRKSSFIESTPTGNNTIEDWIHMGGNNGDYSWIDYVHFIQNGRLFLLSYEPSETFTSGHKIPPNSGRDIYLYSKDTSNINSPWVKASDVVLTSNWDYSIRTAKQV